MIRNLMDCIMKINLRANVLTNVNAKYLIIKVKSVAKNEASTG